MHPANAFAANIALTGISVGLAAGLVASLRLRRTKSRGQTVIPTYALAASAPSGEST